MILKIIWYQALLFDGNNFHANIWFQAYLSNTENLYTMLCYVSFFLSNHLFTNSYMRERNEQTDHLISARRPDLVIKKKRTCKIVNFAVPVEHRVKLKENEKKDKYLDLARKLKKLWNMKLTGIPILIGALGTVIKWFIQGLEEPEKRGDHPNKHPSFHILSVLFCDQPGQQSQQFWKFSFLLLIIVRSGLLAEYSWVF